MRYSITCNICGRIDVLGLVITANCPNSVEHICDKTSAVIQDINCLNLDKDYRRLRDELMQYVISNGGNLPLDELEGAARHFCLPFESREMFFPGVAHYNIADAFNKNMREARAQRFNRAAAYLVVNLDLEQCFTIGKDISVAHLANNYIDYGVEGYYVGDNVEGLYDYLASYSGSPTYSGAGLLQYNWTPTTQTMTHLSDHLIQILKDGKRCVELT